MLRKICTRTSKTLNLLPILAGLAGFAVIYLESGIVSTSSKEKIGHGFLPEQRMLSSREQDPIMREISLLRHVAKALDSTTYSHETERGKSKAVRVLIEDYLSVYPLHLFVETDATIQPEGGSIDRTVKGLYKSDRSGDQ